jgi:hypothetical protein
MEKAFQLKMNVMEQKYQGIVTPYRKNLLLSNKRNLTRRKKTDN